MSGVTKRDRLEAAIAGERADRLPVALWRHFPVDDQDSASLADSTAAFQEQFDFDFVKVTPASSFCLKDWGVDDTWQGNPEGTRTYGRRVVDTPDDWTTLDVLDPRSGLLGEQLACLSRLKERLDPDTPFIQTIFSPLAQAKNLAGGDVLIDHLHRAPEAVLAGLETIARSTIGFVEAAASLGVAGIFYAVQHASFRYFDAQSYARFGIPFDVRILESAGSLWLNVLHLHGDRLIFDVCDSLPAHIVNWHDRTVGPALSDARSLVTGALCGGLRREATMVLGTPSSVRAEAQDAIQSVDGRGLVLGAGCVVPTTAPRANLAAARSAVEFA